MNLTEAIEIFKYQIYFLFVVNLIAFLVFEIMPIFFGKQEKISRNFEDLIKFQFGMSILSIIFGIIISLILKYLKVDVGFINISELNLINQIIAIYTVSEFFIYISHFSAHKFKIPLITNAHKYHHKITTDMEWVNSKKEHPFVVALFVLVFCIVFYTVFKTSILAKILSVNIFVFLQALSHYSEKISIPYFDKFFLFPKDHFNHHTKRSGPYGVTLSIFDTIFKTRV